MGDTKVTQAPLLAPSLTLNRRKETPLLREKWSSVNAWGIADTSTTTKHRKNEYFM